MSPGERRLQMSNLPTMRVAQIALNVISSIQKVDAVPARILGTAVALVSLLRRHGLSYRDVHDLATNYVDGYHTDTPQMLAISDLLHQDKDFTNER